MEHKIGEIFKYDGEWYQCVEGAGCYQCAFDRDENTCTADNPHCTCRSDKKDVVFKKLEKVGEPFSCNYYGDSRLVMMQEYQLFDSNVIYCYQTPPMYITDYKHKRIAIEIKQNKEDMEEKNKAKHSNSEKIGKDLKEFDLEAAKAGEPVCTRDGRKARIICWDRIDSTGGNLPIVALVQCEETEVLQLYHDDGKCDVKADLDLMMLPEEKTKCVFRPYDLVLVRDLDFNIWHNDIFSFRDKDGRYICIGNKGDECIPYNEETAHLLGTTENYE